MSASNEHQSQNGDLGQVLCDLADPQAEGPFADACLALPPKQLFDAILHHGIEPIALRKLTGILPQEPPYPTLIDAVRERQLLANAHALVLEAHALQLTTAIDAQGLNAVIVKGQVFAKALYDRASDRPFTDVDVLAHPASVPAVGAILKDAGFLLYQKQMFDNSARNMEQKWVREDNQNILIELHGNLVHYASLRWRVSFGHDEYWTASGDGDFPNVAYFMTAVIHASAGHKFHRLQLLADVMQAARKLTEEDIRHLNTVLDMLRARLEVLVCLDLVCALFGDEASRHVRDSLSPGREYGFARGLVTRDAVIDTWNDAGHRSRMRRHAFRWVQRVAPR
ncbi:nucleotidyltransferase family protein [Hoeflea poritis]|uniref:Nucleotidyltransferase family protein n=1 Tax=Hoeflea poritis TaxID=2993659 RepID=A0ABT4VQA6_9HYPH|nr:nucleotidyltransferase family protein [Hoeflea poritis]MDA4846203.1 nucleotidyltransferase family protein [Hoeflea poritis]